METHKRTVVVGDIHGCLEEFDELLKLLQFTPRSDTRLVLVGDLVDRGPDSEGVVRRAIEVGAESVLGNHEEKHLRYRKHEQRRAADPTYKNPMRPFKDKRLAEHNSLSEASWAYIEKMPLWLRISPSWFVVHAGCEAGVAIDAQKANVLLRMRYVRLADKKMAQLDEEMAPDTHAYWSDLWTGPANIVFGHHVIAEGFACVDRNRNTGVTTVGVDTGCCFGKRLSAAIFLHGNGEKALFEATVAVPAKAPYSPFTDRE